MTSSRPSLLRLRLLTVHPRLLLTEVQLVHDVLLYRRIDSRDHMPTEVRAVRPSTTDWDALRVVLDEAIFWSWPSRWPRIRVGYEGEFAIAVAWGDRAAVSIGALRVAPAAESVLDVISQLVGNARLRSSGPVPALLSSGPPPPYQPEALGTAVHMQSRVTYAG